MVWAKVKPDEWEMLERRYLMGRPCKPIETRPILYPDLGTVWGAFWTLHASRPHSMNGPAPIPLAEVKAYFDIFPYSGDKEEFVKQIYTLDAEYLSEYYKKTNSSESAGKTKNDRRNNQRRNRNPAG